MLRGLSLYELRLLRNEVYARRGMVFGPAWLSQYFYSQPWYEPSTEEKPKTPELSPIEKQNVELIVKYERNLHDELTTRPITRGMLEGMFREDARKLRNEIYARHGMVFKEKELRNYFSSLDWYRPDPKYTDASLTAVERKNATLILAYERKADSVNDAIEG
jgi:YARHG domain